MSYRQTKEKKQGAQGSWQDLKLASYITSILVICVGVVYLVDSTISDWTFPVLLLLGAVLNGFVVVLGLIRERTLVTWGGGLMLGWLLLGLILLLI